MLFTHVDARFTIIRRDFLRCLKGNSGSEEAAEMEKYFIAVVVALQTRVANKKHTNKLHQHLSAKDVARENVFRVDSIQVRLINDRHFSKPDSESCSVINIWFRKAVRATFTSEH